MNIIDLPVEIVETIAFFVSLVCFGKFWSVFIHLCFKESPVYKKDLANLRTTCKYLDDILAHQVLSIIRLDLSDWRNAQHLIWMNARPNRVHVFARSLKIHCLAPSYSAHRLAPDIVVERDGSYRYIGRPKQDDVIQAIQITSRYLPGALHHFHNLESVECVYLPKLLG